LPLMYYVSIHERIIEDLTTLERHAEALDLYEKILAEYSGWISADMEELEVYDRETIMYNIDRIKTGRAFIKTGSADDLSERIQALENHLIEKPDDSDAYFNLMYLYFDNTQYEHCIGAINNRISIGGINKLPVVSQMKIYYFRGKAALKLGRYQAAVTDMLQTLEIMSGGDDSDNSPNNRFGVYAYLAEAYLGEKAYDLSLEYGFKCANMYTDKNWAWDTESSAFRYTMALAYEGKENMSACKKTIDLIVANDPNYQPALDKKHQLKGGGLFSFFRKKKN
jgi:tetratricopeptide (TPR) repeat protein